MDVCVTKAINMRVHKGKTLEGSNLAYLVFNNKNNSEAAPVGMMTFPYMQSAEKCNGCMICVRECPTSAIEIDSIHEAVMPLNEGVLKR